MNDYKEAYEAVNTVTGQFQVRIARAVASLIFDEDPEKNPTARLEQFQGELDSLVHGGAFAGETQLSEEENLLFLGLHASFLDMLDLVIMEKFQ